MARRVHASVLSVVFLVVVAPWAASGQKAVKPLGTKPIQVKAGTLRGVVKGYTGKPFPHTTLELRDAKGKTVAKTVTNAKGQYVIKNVPPGRYTAVIGGKVKLPLTMTREATVSRLMIVPQFKKTRAAIGGGWGTWTWLAIGGGAAAAVATPIVIHNTRTSSSSTPISP